MCKMVRDGKLLTGSEAKSEAPRKANAAVCEVSASWLRRGNKD